MKIRFLKVVRDLTSDYTKNVMMVLAIGIGVFGIGTILGGYSVLKREMSANYNGTNPASATIEIAQDISQTLLDSIRQLDYISEAERHATVVARMQVRDKWYPLLLFVIDDFAGKKTNKINPVSGPVNPGPGAMLVERTALVVMQANAGDSLLVKTPDGPQRWVRLAGTVHDPGLAPAWQEQTGYGYVTLSTLHWLGETRGFDQLRIVVNGERYSKRYITQKAEELADWLEKKGYEVHEIQVPPPGRHPHQSQMNAVLTIFIIFCFLILVLGSILVASSMATLMVRQVRQIGIMKTIGARSPQISFMYLLMIFILCATALLIAIPLSRVAAGGFVRQISLLLNLEMTDTSVPYWVPVVQVVSGILVPFIAAAFPVLRGSLVSIRVALDNYGVNASNFRTRSWVTRLSGMSFISETLRISLRNVFRQRTRLVMTLGLLAAGGAMFMTAMNVSRAWEENLGRIYVQRLYDLEVKLNHPIDPGPILEKIERVDGITVVEAWGHSSTSFANESKHEITNTYPDKGHGSFTMLALPVPTTLLNPAVVEGKWLDSANSDAVVLNQSARAGLAGVKVGDRVQLSVEGKITKWRVTGFTEDVGSPSTAYVSFRSYSRQLDIAGATMLRIAYRDRSKQNALEKNRRVEKLLADENISVNGTVPVWLLHNAIAAHMRVLVNSLLAMAILMAVVGTLGLMSTMSMNVMERTREIGVMRAIGAHPVQIKNIVMWEGFIIGGLSVFIAFALSLALSYYMGRFIGSISFRTPLALSVSGIAFAIWLAIIVIGSYVATLYPARRANGITTREALSYE
jgi:putative ABC transport system permease protein